MNRTLNVVWLSAKMASEVNELTNQAAAVKLSSIWLADGANPPLPAPPLPVHPVLSVHLADIRLMNTPPGCWTEPQLLTGTPATGVPAINEPINKSPAAVHQLSFGSHGSTF